MNKKKNRGFSLVELIVVVAIMAVLVGVLAPSLLRYVEKTRIQKDVSAVSEVREAVIVAMADEDIFDENISGLDLTVTDKTAIGTSGSKLAAELATVIGSTGVDFTSKAMNGNAVVLRIEVSNGTVTCVYDKTKSAALSNKVDDATAVGLLENIK